MTARVTSVHRGRSIGIAISVALALGLIGLWSARRPIAPAPDRGRPELRALVQAVGPRRFIEARLTGGFEYGTFVPLSRHAQAGSPQLPPDVRIALADIERRHSAEDDPGNDAVWATAKLVAGDTDGAITLFDSALARADDRPEIWNDAAAAYLSASTQLGRHELWIQALEAAERARRLRPNLPEAIFNRALSLEGLQLIDQAREAWQDYLALDSQSRWADEARTRQHALTERLALSATWQAFQTSLAARLPKPNPSDRQAATRFRQDLRIWIERDLIPAWASASLANDAPRALAALQRARAAAQLLRESGGDPLPAATLIRAEELSDQNPALARGLATAHLAFPKIVQLSDDGAYGQAAADFERVYPMFRDAGSPYAEFNALYTGVAFYMARRLDRARATLSTLDRTTGDVSYLGGMRAWMEGLIDLNQNRLHQARAHYRTALRRFEAIGETDSIGRICALLAETHAALGDPRQAWMYQRLALAQVPFIQVPRRKHLILQSGGLLCLRERMSHSALVFQNAVIGTAKAAGARLPSLVEGYLHRARTYARIGRQTDATTDLDLARALLPKIDAETVRRSYAAEIEGAAAEVLTIVSPDVAVAAASRALEYYDGNGEFKRAGLYLQRGRAQLARQRADLAEADFAAAIDRFEALREHVLERQDRVRLFRDGMSAYSEMVRLTVQNRQDPAAALDFAERARARTLLEALMGPSAKPDPVAMLARQVPAGTAVLFYGTQTDRLWLWVLRADGIRFFDRAVPLHDLQFRIARVGRLLTRPGSSRPSEDRALRQALQSLFTDLIGPARDLVGDVGALVVVPDGPLHSLPFAALVDPSTNQFLIQTHVIGVAPSLTTFRRALSDGGIPRRAHALVVGDPTIGDGDPSLGPLPFAREEAQNLGRIYAGARVLLEGAATPDAFLAHLQHADVVHYAGHAIVDMQEPDRSHLRLASDGAHPLGILFVHQLRSSMLRRHPLVVLAACSTNRGRIEIGEGVLSLARPFLAAGASDVIATLWDVEDRGSAELFTRFHKKAAAGVPAARALAEVQRDLLGLSDSDARGPANWAWAVAIGGAVR